MRLFVGVAVGDEVRAAAARARARIDAGLQQLHREPPRLVWVAPQALHLTLQFLGEQPDASVAELLAAIEAPFRLPPFTVTWHGLGAFPSPRRPRAIWLGVAAGAAQLGELEREVASRATGLLSGEELTDTKPFHPHLTLARVKTETRGVNWPSILADAAVSDVSSPVTHVTLFQSRGLPGGAGYEELGRGPLDG